MFPTMSAVRLVRALALQEYQAIPLLRDEAFARWEATNLESEDPETEFRQQLIVTQDLVMRAFWYGAQEPISLAMAANALVTLEDYIPVRYGTADRDAMKAWAEVARLWGLCRTKGKEMKTDVSEFWAEQAGLPEEERERRI